MLLDCHVSGTSSKKTGEFEFSVPLFTIAVFNADNIQIICKALGYLFRTLKAVSRRKKLFNREERGERSEERKSREERGKKEERNCQGCCCMSK